MKFTTQEKDILLNYILSDLPYKVLPIIQINNEYLGDIIASIELDKELSLEELAFILSMFSRYYFYITNEIETISPYLLQDYFDTFDRVKLQLENTYGKIC